MERAFVKLPASWVVVFVMKEIEGYSHNEIGERLGIKPGTSKARLHYARRALRASLGEPSLYLGN